MTKNLDDQLEEMLVEWELARQNGRDLSTTQLCAGDTELAKKLEQKITALKTTSWILVDEASHDAEEHSDPWKISQQNQETALPQSDVTLAEFVDSVTDSEILSEAEIQTVKEYAGEEDSSSASDLATRLVHDDVLTAYQARVILEREDSPLLLDRYVILDTIGSGGMGIVFKAFHRSMERIVALKVLPQFAVNSPEKVLRFKREIKAAAKLSHPNIVTALDAHGSNGTYFLVMEYVDGKNLMEHVVANGPFSVEDAINIIAQIAAGLNEAHRQGIIHRDVKPTNIMLSENGIAKLLDLGLSRTKQIAKEVSNKELTQDGLVLGTLAYMSPEQAIDAKQADARSDIYSLGCTLHFLLTGHPPFDKLTSIQTILAHHEESPPPLGDKGRDIPESVERVFRRMIAKDPDSRPASAEQLHADLVACGATAGLLSASAAQGPLSMPVVQRTATIVNNRRSEKFSARKVTAWVAIVFAVIGVGWLALYLNNSSGSGSSDELAKIAGNKSSREIAKWILNSGGSITAETDSAEEEILFEVSEIPQGSFEIIGITFQRVHERASAPLKRIAHLRKVQSLTLIDFRTVDLEQIKKMKSVSFLALISCSITDSDMSTIATMENIETLDLSGNTISDRGIQDLTKMQGLVDFTLQEVSITDKAIQAIGTLPNLRTLDLSTSTITNADLAHLPPQLIELHLANCSINDEAVVGLAKLQHLQMIDLSGTQITDQGLVSLQSLKHLYALDIGKTAVTDAGIHAIRKHSALTELYLNEIPISERMIERILKMKRLEILDLSGTDLNDTGLAELTFLSRLLTLYVGSTKVSAAGVDRFLKESPDCEVIFDAAPDDDDDVMPDDDWIPADTLK